MRRAHSRAERRRVRAQLAENREMLVRSLVLDPDAVVTRELLWQRHFDLLERLA